MKSDKKFLFFEIYTLNFYRMRWILILLKEESYYYKRTLIQTLNPLSANVEYINMDHAFFKKKRPTPTTPCLKWAVPKGP